MTIEETTDFLMERIPRFSIEVNRILARLVEEFKNAYERGELSYLLTVENVVEFADDLVSRKLSAVTAEEALSDALEAKIYSKFPEVAERLQASQIVNRIIGLKIS